VEVGGGGLEEFPVDEAVSPTLYTGVSSGLNRP
jgi:hypothetical protein